MSPMFGVPLVVSVAVVGAVFVSRVMAWSFSTARRHRLEAKAYAKAARHRANRRTA